MNGTYKYILLYTLSYIVLLVCYGILQNIAICTDMEGFECNFSESKIIAFLTVTAYILTPIVAIFGFQNWKEQYKYQKQKDRFAKLFDSTLRLNSEIKILRSRDITVRTINMNEPSIDYQSEVLDKKYEEYLDQIAKLERIYEDCLIHLSILEFSLDRRMNGFRKIINTNQKIYEECRENFYRYLQTFENRSQTHPLRDTYKSNVSSREEMRKILQLNFLNNPNADAIYNKTVTHRVIEISERIKKYISKVEKYY
ncbi:hypothetical protein V8P95_15125 [Acinetobacter baumannii]